tara:strand:+ start:833 stop:1762 length:930 start_codon:yes stop_codon:yes gene_type:complete
VDNQEAQILPDEADVMKQSNDFDVEIVDDRPTEDQRSPRQEAESDDFNIDEEIDGVNDQVKKRINRLKYEYHEQRREKEENARIRDEAVQYAQSIQQQNEKLSDIVNRSEEALIKSVSTRADTEIKAAKQAYKKAYDEGDSEALVLAQESLTKAQTDKTYLQNYQPQPQKVEAAKSFDQQPQTADPRTQTWIDNNQWFGQPGYEEMTGFAFGLHESLTKKNITSKSDKYFDTINSRLHKTFPEFFNVGKEEDVQPTSTRRKNTVVASAQREGKNPRKVQLTQTQVKLAKRLGITPEQYARQMVKESKRG